MFRIIMLINIIRFKCFFDRSLENCKTCLDKKDYAWKIDRTINENENEISAKISASIVSQFFFFEL